MLLVRTVEMAVGQPRIRNRWFSGRSRNCLSQQPAPFFDLVRNWTNWGWSISSPPQFISHHVHHDLAFLCLSFDHWASHWYHGFLLSCHFRQPFQSIVGDSQLRMTAVPVWHTHPKPMSVPLSLPACPPLPSSVCGVKRQTLLTNYSYLPCVLNTNSLSLQGLSLVRSQQPTLYDFPAPSQALQHRCPPPTRVPGQIIRGLVSTFFSYASPS